MEVPLTETEKQIVWMFAIQRHHAMRGVSLESAFADAVVLFNAARYQLSANFVQTSFDVKHGPQDNCQHYFVRIDSNGTVHYFTELPSVPDDA